MNYDRIFQEFYAAFLKAAEMTGDSYKQLSWFARNKPKQAAAEKQEAALMADVKKNCGVGQSIESDKTLDSFLNAWKNHMSTYQVGKHSQELHNAQGKPIPCAILPSLVTGS